MSFSLKHGSTAVAAICGLCINAAIAQEPGGRHVWTFEAEAGYAGASSPLAAWTKGAPGKLRYDEDDQGFVPGRLVATYRGQITPTLHGYAVIDYLDDASDGLGIAEA
ncbi:MAG TPA: hypothetical protein VLD39_10090, partial [Gammaproteobacteria bacterium]|nr:hypothetical protein [Gammaproteobacteria bacterium]